jgi:hypothetical protein
MLGAELNAAIEEEWPAPVTHAKRFRWWLEEKAESLNGSRPGGDEPLGRRAESGDEPLGRRAESGDEPLGRVAESGEPTAATAKADGATS